MKEKDKARDWPHYIEKKQGGACKWIENDGIYHSTTILGKIYDLVKGQSDSLDMTTHLGLLIDVSSTHGFQIIWLNSIHYDMLNLFS